MAVITYAALIFIFATTGGFKQLAILASCALLLIYLAVVLAVIRLRYKKDNHNESSFQLPGGLLIPLIAIASIICYFYSSSMRDLFCKEAL
jgi:APA family basic amino acid/polyamine antiporter